MLRSRAYDWWHPECSDLSAEPMRLEWLTLPMGSYARTDARFALRIDRAAARGRWPTAGVRSAVVSASAHKAEELASQLVPLWPLAIGTTRLQWFVLNPLEELRMTQRARLVLDEGDRREREAERARSQGLVERVARV